MDRSGMLRQHHAHPKCAEHWLLQVNVSPHLLEHVVGNRQGEARSWNALVEPPATPQWRLQTVV